MANFTDKKEMAEALVNHKDIRITRWNNGQLYSIKYKGLDMENLFVDLLGYDHWLDIRSQIKELYPVETAEDHGDIQQENRKEEKHYGC